MFSILLLLPTGSVRPSGNLLYNGVLLLQNIRTVFSTSSTLLLKHIITLFYTFSLRYLYQQKIKVNKIIHSSRKVLVATQMFGYDLIRFQATLISEKFSARHNSCHKSTSIKEPWIAKSSEISNHLHKTKKRKTTNKTLRKVLSKILHLILTFARKQLETEVQL